MDADTIRDLFAQFRPVEVRRLFGGAGLFVDGVMFGIAFDGVVFLKTSDTTRPQFEREGAAPFVYPLAKRPRRRRGPSSYWRLPERLYDDPDELARWAAAALAVAQSKATAKAKGAARPRRALGARKRRRV